MAAMLSQQHADALLTEAKEFCRSDVIELYPGADYARTVRGLTSHEEFLLDIAVGKRGRLKVKYQTRGRRVVVLARLDVNGPPHRNPDGVQVGRNHLHIYKEGYADKWAYPLSTYAQLDNTDFPAVLGWFMQHCRIGNAPPIQEAFA